MDAASSSSCRESSEAVRLGVPLVSSSLTMAVAPAVESDSVNEPPRAMASMAKVSTVESG
jgi:hypothetical protein